MKTFAIVNGSVLETTYQAEEALTEQQIKKRFGGPWGRLEEREHLEIPEELKDNLLSDLEARFMDVEVACVGVPQFDENGDPVMELAFDDEDQPIMGPDGNQLEVQVHTQEHITENKKVICLKA